MRRPRRFEWLRDTGPLFGLPVSKTETRIAELTDNGTNILFLVLGNNTLVESHDFRHFFCYERIPVRTYVYLINKHGFTKSYKDLTQIVKRATGIVTTASFTPDSFRFIVTFHKTVSFIRNTLLAFI